MTSLVLKHQSSQAHKASTSWCVMGTRTEKSYLDCTQPSLQPVARPFAIRNLEAGT